MPSKHIEKPGIRCQGQTWASRIIPQVFPSGADLVYTGEAFISYRERQNHPAWPHHQPAVTPACAGKAHPFQAGPALALLVLFSRHFCVLHSHKQSFVSWGRWNSWNQHCVQVCLAERLQRNLTIFFSRRMPDRALVVLHPTKQMWNCQAPMQVLSGLLYSTYSDRPKICSLLPSKLAIYSL